MYIKRRFVLCALLISLVATLARAQVYSITDLGSLSPTAINIWGQVVGSVNGKAFVWTRFTGLKTLGTLTGGTYSSATSINDLGVVTGTADGAGTVFFSPPAQNLQCSDLVQPFVWTSWSGIKGLNTVGTFPPAGWGCEVPFSATGINAPGQVVGYTGELGSYQYGFLWTKSGGMSLFGGSFPPTFGNATSNTGQIVGQNSDEMTFGTGHATSWNGGVATDLGTLGGDVADYGSSANGVNDLGQVVGWSTTSPGFSSVHAVLWTRGGGISDLGTLYPDTSSAALQINFFGKVIGSSGDILLNIPNIFGLDPYPLEVVGRPFIWSERSGMQDLNTLINTSSGWVLNTATGINIWGQIVGSGTRNGQTHGFLLTPKKL
jgi:probable HAF family extracellular repeat protein